MPRAALLLIALAVPALISGQQRAAGDAPFRTIRGQVVADEANSGPLRRVRISLSSSSAVSSPIYTDERGRFELLAPASGPYSLRFTKAGFAPQDVDRAAADVPGELQIRLARGAAISGRVADTYGDPLLVRVRVRRVSDAAGRAVGASEWTADGDDLGDFRVGSLPAGRYEVSVEANNLAIPAPPPGAARADAARRPTVVQLGAGEEANLSFIEEAEPTDPRGRFIGGSRTPVVENGGTIRGRVVQADSRSVGGAFIQLFAGVESARQTASDRAGEFEFAGLPPGTYRINAGKIGASLSMADRNLEVTVRQGQTVDRVAVVVQKPSAIVGTVLDAFGEPVEGIDVELLDAWRGAGRTLLERAPDVRPRRTDDRGRYRLFPVRPGEHYVVAGEEARIVRGGAQGPDTSLRVYYPGTAVIGEAAPVRVAAGQDTVGVSISYAAAVGVRVSGYAFDASGEPLKSPVTLIESHRAGGPLMARRQALVREDAAFVFENIPPGDYVVQGLVRPSPGRLPEFGLAFVTVGGGEVLPVTIRTSPGTAVRGRVVLEGDASNVQIDSFGVGADPTDLDYAIVGVDAAGTGVGEDGTFELRLHGPMRFASRSVPRGWWLKSAMIGAVDAADQPYSFTGRPVDVTVVFSDAVAELSGRVTDANGQPARAGSVLVFPVDQSKWNFASQFVYDAPVGAGPPGDPEPAAAGTYRVFPLPPGHYWVVATDHPDIGFVRRDPESLRDLIPQAQSIAITERQKAVRDLRVVQPHRP